MEELAKEHHSEFGLGKLADNVGLTMCVTRTGKAIGGIKDSADQKHDAVMVAQSKLLLRSLGRVISEEIHDAGEPLVVRRGINTAFGKLWPEIEKHVIDDAAREGASSGGTATTSRAKRWRRGLTGSARARCCCCTR